MKYYIKTFCNIYGDEQNPFTLVWRKGEYYEIYNESDNYIYCDNEYLRKLNQDNLTLNNYIAKAWVNIKGIKKIKGILPLNFIRLSEDEAIAEKRKKINNNP